MTPELVEVGGFLFRLTPQGFGGARKHPQAKVAKLRATAENRVDLLITDRNRESLGGAR